METCLRDVLFSVRLFHGREFRRRICCQKNSWIIDLMGVPYPCLVSGCSPDCFSRFRIVKDTAASAS